ncbi:16S rRNA (cytidine(1402)-2'-O)-methyltransferase [Caldibacillus lycopersici]|uniref:Ribosomal RNA small subunit methyltransferase I n=1 Tax=Perspicuibacillus lycopersici TaxID=1325689 RepID=A0AAE3IXC7_9BACI|nr:16S rRNA (cytidine(1402)-2'-O)-methyltransferase [Perspicuibacillus lycopersici]MCU9615303.1 16S rRNA (cytidine(1402)-2'-O)-methyltransferase [Perspicuibacillus lycopersici]
MKLQKSFLNDNGILYLVPTPIGNLEDMTFRAIRILKEADIIAAEDTRNTKRLLNYFEITTSMTSYHEHNKEISGRQLIQMLQEGKTIALVSDAGMPAISDPGYELVAEAIKEGINVISLPGANAALTAITASGIAPQPFYFYGFLPRKKKEKESELESLKYIKATMIFYEAPHRIKETVLSLFEVFGNRNVVLGRELTKKFEEYIRGTLSEVLEWLKEGEIRGEFCIVIEGTKEENIFEQQVWWENLNVVEHVDHYIKQGMQTKDAIKTTAKDRGVGKREVYQIYHINGETE